MKRLGMYKVEGFLGPDPPRKYSGITGFGLGGYGYSIHLDPDFARMAVKVKQPDMEFFNEKTRDRLERIKLADCPSRYITFYENSCLATNFTVAGNACGLDVDWNEFDRVLAGEESIYAYLTYHSHNIDTMAQAYGLLSIFSHWYDLADAIIELNESDPKRPFDI